MWTIGRTRRFTFLKHQARHAYDIVLNAIALRAFHYDNKLHSTGRYPARIGGPSASILEGPIAWRRIVAHSFGIPSHLFEGDSIYSVLIIGQIGHVDH